MTTISDSDRAGIRLYWWQGGLYIEPTTDEQRALLVGLVSLLDGVRINQQIPTSPIAAIETGHQHAVVGINELSDVVAQRSGSDPSGPSHNPL